MNWLPKLLSKNDLNPLKEIIKKIIEACISFKYSSSATNKARTQQEPYPFSASL